MKRVSQALKSLLKTAIIFYVACLVLITIFQRQLMYFPDNSPVTPEQVNLQDTQDITLSTKDGERLQAWYHHPEKGEYTIVYFHGNAGHIGYRAGRLRHFMEDGFGFLITSYRGYGSSTGSPSEQGLYTDAHTALNYILQTQGIAPESVLLYGESMGTGVATEMATHYNLGGLILEAPYKSVRERSQEMFPWLPAQWMVWDEYDSLSKISSVDEPLLIFHGEKDPVIPISHGRALFEAANEPKKAYFLPFIYHHNFDREMIDASIIAFYKQSLN